MQFRQLFLFFFLLIVCFCENCDYPVDATSEIKSQKLLFDQNQSILDYHCTQYELPLSYKQAEITIASSRVKHFIISDKPINKCSELSFNECPEDSTICTRSLNHVEKITKEKIGLCLEKLYITVMVTCQAPQGESNGYVLAEMNNDACNPIKDTDAIKCASYSEHQCGNPDSFQCTQKCYWVDCNIIDSNNKNQMIFGSCLPSSEYKDYQQRESCRASLEWATQEEQDSSKISYAPKWCGGKAPSHIIGDIEEKAQHMSWWESILAFLFMIFLLFCCIVCLYRYELATNKFPPFTPPDFCPESIFPRVNKDFVQMARPQNKFDDFNDDFQLEDISKKNEEKKEDN